MIYILKHTWTDFDESTGTRKFTHNVGYSTNKQELESLARQYNERIAVLLNTHAETLADLTCRMYPEQFDEICEAAGLTPADFKHVMAERRTIWGVDELVTEYGLPGRYDFLSVGYSIEELSSIEKNCQSFDEHLL